MTRRTSRLRDLQSEWNAMVPAAQAQGINVRPVALYFYPHGLREHVPHRQNRVNWLRAQLANRTAMTQVTTEFTFGVEIELILPVGTTHAILAQAIDNAGVPCRSEFYNHRTSAQWKVVEDGSLGDRIHGAEVVSPVLTGDVGFEQVRKVCAVLGTIGAKVNKRCGLHVHIGVRAEQLSFFKNVVRLYSQAEGVIDGFVAPSRRANANHFAQPVSINQAALDRATNVEQVALACHQDNTPSMVRSPRRYRKVNLQSFWQHGTIEFRQHQGTVEAEKIENWVRFCMRMCAAARKGVAPVNTLDALFSTLDSTATEKEYFTRRTTYFTTRR